MSLDYPNRNVWLAKRATPRNLHRGVYRHVSVTSRGGITYAVGATQRKAAIYERKLATTKARRAAKRSAATRTSL